MKTSPSEIDRLCTVIDQWIRSGQGNRARHLLHRLAGKAANTKIPRAQTAPLAALARRANLPLLGLRLLNPLVRETGHRRPDASVREKAEYAGCLTHLGAAAEAIEILETLDSKALPSVLLFRSFAHISRWEYAESIPFLTRYVHTDSLSPYQHLVGQLNLADAFVQVGKYLKAGVLLQDLIHQASVQKHYNLAGKAMEIAAQKFLFQSKWAPAEQLLDRAERLLSETESLDLFFVRKWKAVLALRRDGATARLATVRAEALELRHWETVRDCDRFSAVYRQDEGLFHHLYFGTPFPPFRDRLIRDFGSTEPAPSYLWKLKGGTGPRIEINLIAAECRGLRHAFKYAQIEHKLLQILARDFYRPVPLATFHSLLYPGEYFSPVSSAARVYNSLKRLRYWIRKSGAPLVVREQGGHYRLEASRPCDVRVCLQEVLPAKTQSLERLRSVWGKRDFSKDDVVQALGISSRTAQRLIGSAENEGRITRAGIGPSTRFSFTAVKK
jgi:hypothetical protein